MERDDLVEKITQEVLKRLNERPAEGVRPAYEPGSGAKLAGYIDHTLLKPEASRGQIEGLCKEAVAHKFCAVCVNSCWTALAARQLRGTGVKVAVVVGFPLGSMDSRCKGFEARHAVEEGADEIDMVLNIGALIEGNLKLVEEDIRQVRRSIRQTTVLKVILETVFLSEEQKVIACRISQKAGADFVKTSTGFSGGGATVEDIALMRRVVGPSMGVKASGGVRNAEQAARLIAAGANRLGTSSGVLIVKGGEAQGY